jgi:hypothetical protein
MRNVLTVKVFRVTSNYDNPGHNWIVSLYDTGARHGIGVCLSQWTNRDDAIKDAEHFANENGWSLVINPDVASDLAHRTSEALEARLPEGVVLGEEERKIIHDALHQAAETALTRSRLS